MKHLLPNHDLTLPAFGPYTKQYMGISHLPAANDGMRFDLSVFAGFYRRRADVPNVRFESSWHPWQAAPDLSYYSYRQELEWKDRVYCQVAFAAGQADASIICAECVNNTDLPHNLVLHWIASAHYPKPSYRNFEVTGAEIHLPASAALTGALDYEELTFFLPRANDHLVMDGMRRGEEAVEGFVTGYGLGSNFGAAESQFWGMVRPCGKGDTVTYRLQAKAGLKAPMLGVRYLNPASEAGKLTIAQTGEILELPACTSPQLVWVPFAPAEKGEYTLTLTGHGVGAAKLDCFLLCEAEEVEQVSIQTRAADRKPQIIEGDGCVVLKYPHIKEYYGIAWDDSVLTELRQLLNSELDIFLRETVHDHVNRVLQGDGKGHFTDVFQRPLTLAPHTSRKLYGLLCCANTAEEALKMCARFQSERIQAVRILEASAKKAELPAALPEAEAYRFGVERMAAVLLTNTVYPVYLRGGYIRHNAPGRWWDCLYTWDSGFIGMGLATLSARRGFDCLNTYLTPEGDPHGAFVQHGSMVPMQFYQYQELRNRTGSRPLAEYCYPRLRQYYRFFTGKQGGSTMANLPGDLLRPWDYFYNSGGWDDYPAQKELHVRKAEAVGTPVCTTSHAICCARILENAARELGLDEEAAEYAADIERFAQALQTYAWNETEGCFDYLLQDGDKKVPMTTDSGRSWNLGLDGLSPLFAGVCTPTQQQRLCALLQDEKHYWTPIGLSTVDQAAPYYRVDGYWNGAVWMPYQWLYFKAMLDCGQADFAWRIAQTALATWQKETSDTYNCYEHFMVQSGRGAGWHQFSGLSSPILQWYESYFVPGTLTLGLQGFVSAQSWNEDKTALTATICTAGGTAVAVMASGKAYAVTVNGRPTEAHSRIGTTLEWNLPAGECTIRITAQ